MAQEDTLRDAGSEGEKPQKRYQRILHSKGFIPTIVVAGLIFLVLLSSRLAGRPPQIDEITPRIGKPGDVMIITGRYFGRERGGGVRISGISPTSGEYIEWTDTTISVVIPDEAGSGLVYVITKNGRSKGILFTNSAQIPVPATGPSRPGEPAIDVIQPMAAHVGEKITIKGKNFGLEKGSSEVYFTWGGSAQPDAGGTFDPANLVPARDYNFDYLSWSDIEIVVKVPDGAASGNIMVTSDKGRSNSAYFEVLGGAGMKNFSNPRKYTVRYGLSVKDVGASGGNCLYLWMPRVILTSEQRKVQLVSQEPEPLLEDHNGAALFALSNIQKGGKYTIGLSYSFDRYAVETQVNPGKVPLAYDTSSELYAHFTQPDSDIPSDSSEIKKTVSTILQGEKNPYLKAKRIYDFVVSQLAYSASLDADPVAVIKSKRGDAFGFAAVTCTLLRAAGIPARMVSGYLVRSDQTPARHFWGEFYIDTLGWIPVDPLLAASKTLSPLPADSNLDPKSFYFGGLDNSHITFSKGLETVNQMNPDSKPKRNRSLPYLLSIDEEATGGISDYKAAFEDLTEVPGTY